jgi:hypothetical protein
MTEKSTGANIIEEFYSEKEEAVEVDRNVTITVRLHKHDALMLKLISKLIHQSRATLMKTLVESDVHDMFHSLDMDDQQILSSKVDAELAKNSLISEKDHQWYFELF